MTNYKHLAKEKTQTLIRFSIRLCHLYYYYTYVA